MTDHNQTKTDISRRQFLKFGCLGTAAVGVTVCGATALRPEIPPLEYKSYTFGEKMMKPKILIAYASYAGSTMGIASDIGKTISEAGFQVDVRPMTESPDLDGYDTILLGSAVQNGTWLPEALAYIQSNRQKLNQMPVAAFSVHITNTGNDFASRQKRNSFLDDVRALITLDEEVFFPGRFDRRGAEKMMPKVIARFIPTTDLRKPEIVQAWAENIPAKLLPVHEELTINK